MWQLAIYSPNKESKLVELKPGTLTLGRANTNDIIVDDISASRQHAEVVFDSTTNTISILDLNSTNGTFVNDLQITGSYQLNKDDRVNIGQFSMQLQRYPDGRRVASDTHPLTRELLLETMYKNSVHVYESAIKLNNVQNLETALTTTTNLIKQALQINTCEIILSDRLKSMGTIDFIDPLARKAAINGTIEITPTKMFIPIQYIDETLGLICTIQTEETRPFEERDQKLAIAISHQAALAIQRIRHLEKIRREEQVQRLMLRFISPTETEHLLADFYENGELPGLKDQKVTILFSEIANSTLLAQELGTEHFSKILNGFYTVATQTIFMHNGMVKYLGDGVLAMFVEQEGGISPEEKAINTGRELINMLNHTGSLDPKQRIVIGVSINTGNAMVGYVGTKEHAEFNVLGDTVNIAHRMREYASQYKIIVGHTTMISLGNKYRFRNAGVVKLHENEQSIQIYEVLP